jgi:PAS domain-containing protein
MRTSPPTSEMERERLQLLIAHLPQGVCMFDRQERLIVSNARYAEIYGIDPEKIRTGMLLSEILELRVAAGAYHGDPTSYLLNRNAAGRKTEAFGVTQ